MANLKQFKLPDLGEGLTEGEILKWLVQPGDEVKLNQPIVEVETAKAAVEIPSPYAGVVTELHHGEGETVDVGSPILTFDIGGEGGGEGGVGAGEPVTAADDMTGGIAQRAAASQAAGAAANPAESASAAAAAGDRSARADGMVPAALIESPPDDAAVEPGLIGGPAPGGRTSVLVGYGPKSVVAKRRARKPGLDFTPPDKPRDHAQATRPTGAAVGAVAAERATGAAGIAALAKPPVRKLARDLGVDLVAVRGTGPGGTITRADVEAAAGGAAQQAASPAAAAAAAPSYEGVGEAPAAPSFDAATREQRIPIKGVRKHMAAAMVESAFTAPHVTEFITIDVTPTMELLERLKAMKQFQGLKVTPLLVVAKALMLAVRRNPLVNATWDDEAGEIVVKDYVNLGIAAATPRGLIVPNIKDAGRLTLPELAAALGELATTAREGKTAPADMQGGTITITNVGVFGVDTGTPIINPGESAILALGAVRQQPWVVDGEIAVRWVTTLGLSFDHRLVDGQLGSQFLADIAAMLSDPMAFVLYS